MHAEIRQLIALRDGEPVEVAAAEHVRECGACRERIREMNELRAALRGLPDAMPPSHAWEQIVALRELETGIAGRRLLHVRPLAAFSALGALAVALIAFGVILQQQPSPLPGESAGNAAKRDVTLADLQQRSRELEYLLQRYGPAGVVSLRTAGTFMEIEDSIALIDYQLNTARESRSALDDEQYRDLWEQRVALMETLLTVRTAEYYAGSI